jgi:hypothetical protein
MISLKNYDLAAAKERMRRSSSRERGLGRTCDATRAIRELQSAADAADRVGYAIIDALATLSCQEGGTASPVGSNGAWEAVLENLKPELPLVQALLTLYACPGHTGFGGIVLERPGQTNGRKIGPVLERLRTEHPQTFDPDRVVQLVFGELARVYGDNEIDPLWLPEQIYPGSRIGEYMYPIYKTMLYDVFGAFDPGFTRRDALVGEWWLVQPVSPRLDHWDLASRSGLELAGFLSPTHVDVEGRVIMACFEVDPMPDEHRTTLLDSKWIAGWERVTWATDRAPLADPGFDLLTVLEDIPEDSYGPYKHSSELPPWPPRG